jgi:hypothetical protein
MKYTKKFPELAGYYWMKLDSPTCYGDIEYVTIHKGKWCTQGSYDHNYGDYYYHSFNPDNYLFCGPLEEPDDP